MAVLKLSQIAAGSAPASTDTVVGVQGGTTDAQLTFAQVQSFVLSGANTRLGGSDAASPVSQTLSVQNVSTGTTNTAGVDFTINGSQGTGSANGGGLILNIAPAGTSGTSQNALVSILEIFGNGHIQFSSTTGSSILDYGVSNAGTWTMGANYFCQGNFKVSGDIQAGANGEFFWSGRSVLFSTADGLITIANDAGTDFGRLQFGGTTSSFPALKRDLTGLDVRLADDSAFSSLQVSDIYTNDATFLIRTKTLLTNNAAANTGTLTNAPSPGNPTKWIGIDDNGTTRFVPAW